VRRPECGFLCPISTLFSASHVDYVFYSALIGVTTLVWVGYDIACQWHVNLHKRDVPVECKPTFSVPKLKKEVGALHVIGHKSECQQIFTPEFLEHNGRTNPDNIEHGWATMNGVSLACRRMTPGHRSDTLDDHLGHYNWMKTINLGASAVWCALHRW
jgi:hypothetical protein